MPNDDFMAALEGVNEMAEMTLKQELLRALKPHPEAQDLADDDGPVFAPIARARDLLQEEICGCGPFDPDDVEVHEIECPVPQARVLVRDLNTALKGTKWERKE